MVKVSIRLVSYVPIVALVVLLFLQIFSPRPGILFVLVAIVGVLLIAYVWARQMARGVLIQRQRRYGWAQVGDVIEERFTMHNDAWLPVLWAEVRDFSNLPGYNASRAVGLAARRSSRWATEGTCERRGVYTLGPITIALGDPFGLFEVKLEHNYTETFVVYPPIAGLPSLLDPRGLARGAARTNIRSLDLTTNASAVRHYVPGDALNRIHWRTTARRSTPDREEIFVKEFDLEPSGDLWIVLDMDRRVQAGADLESTEEYAVVLAASLANQMLRDNHAVGLIAYGKEPLVVRPQKGHQQLWEILRVLAGVHAVAEVSLGEVLNLTQSIIGRGMSVALVTPSASAEWIHGVSDLLRRSIHPTGLLLDAGTFGGEVGNLQGLLGALADLGVSGHIIAQGFRFEQLGHRRQQRPEYRTLGTGRVIAINPEDTSGTEWVSAASGERLEKA
jgi:uncharacterized protein (DUF58 family)